MKDICDWLEENGYEEVLAAIDLVKRQKADAELKTRRNWWNILSGTLAGKRRTDTGIEFPILAAARRRKNWPVVAGEQQKPGETAPPPIVQSGRWPKPAAAPEQPAAAAKPRKLRKGGVGSEPEISSAPPAPPRMTAGPSRRRRSS